MFFGRNFDSRETRVARFTRNDANGSDNTERLEK
jgi:hypothetical protein